MATPHAIGSPGVPARSMDRIRDQSHYMSGNASSCSGNDMRTIGAAQFKAQCLALLDQLESDGLIITKHGKPVARVLPYAQQEADLIGSLRHKVKINGDILTTGLRWDADAQS